MGDYSDFYSIYGYLHILKDVYNPEAFYKSNKENIDAIIELTAGFDYGISFEIDSNHSLLCAFTISGDDPEQAKENYAKMLHIVKEHFPSTTEVIKIESKEDSEGQFFNWDTPDPFPTFVDLMTEEG